MNAEIKIEPEQAVEDFLAEKKDEVAFSSWRNYKYPLKQFIEFCDGRDLEYMNEVNGYDLKKFKLQRRATGIKEVTLKNTYPHYGRSSGGVRKPRLSNRD